MTKGQIKLDIVCLADVTPQIRPPAAEAAYRRGFQHGLTALIDLLENEEVWSQRARVFLEAAEITAARLRESAGSHPDYMAEFFRLSAKSAKSKIRRRRP